MRLRTLSFISLIAIALIPSLILSAVIYQKVYQLVEAGVEQKLERLAKRIDTDVLHQTELLATGLHLLSEHKIMRFGIDNLLYAGQVVSALNEFGNNYPMIESLYLISNDGYVVESYAGNILALEESPLIDFQYDSTLLNHTSKDSAENSHSRPWVEYFENSDLLKHNNESHGIAFIVPVSSNAKMNSIEIHGYLLAIIPVSKLGLLAAKEKSEQEKVNFSIQGQLIQGESISAAKDPVIKSRHIAFSSSKFKNILWLDLNVAQSREDISASIRAAIKPVLTTGVVIFFMLILIAVALAHLFSQTFNQLNTLIYGFERGEKISSQSFFISEFKGVNNLLSRLQKTITDQLRSLEDKNSELVKVNLLREKYLLEVRELNAGLEQQVESRTSELENTLKEVEHSHFVFGKLIQFRRQLESCSGNRAVAKTLYESINTCLPGVSMAIFLPAEHKHRSIANNYNMDDFNFSDVTQQLQSNNQYDGMSQIIIDGETLHINVFRVSDNQFGWLVIKEYDADKNNWLTLFIAEIHSYLMMRALNENLDLLASTDSLTNLKNRKAFDQLILKLARKKEAEVGLYIIDINGLKPINDIEGHEKGDLLIKRAARLLTESAEGVSRQVFRIGGDEFAIILSGSSVALNEKLHANLVQKQLDSHDDTTAVSFSFGYVSTAECAFELLYKTADSKMYADKGNHYRRRKDDNS